MGRDIRRAPSPLYSAEEKIRIVFAGEMMRRIIFASRDPRRHRLRAPLSPTERLNTDVKVNSVKFLWNVS